MNVVIWCCSIGSFLSIQHTLDCQISQLSGRDMSMSPWIHHLIDMFHLKGSTCLRTKFLFHSSWRNSKIISINISNALMSLGGKILNSSILVRCLSWEQLYHWYTSHTTTHFHPKLRYRVSIMTLTKCRYSYKLCTYMLR